MSAPQRVVDLVPKYRELLIGCGNARAKMMGKPGDPKWHSMDSMDIDPLCNPDILHDLNHTPWPFDDNTFDEVHAYQILEHLGQQGDYPSFFALFSEIYRVLKPTGCLFATVSSVHSDWLWGDPGHRRAISMNSITFLIQPEYDKQIGVTAMTDYRHIYKADFDTLLLNDDKRDLRVVLKAVKPSRCSK